MTLPDLIVGVRQDLALVEDMARWAWVDGWSQAGPNPDRASRPLPMEARDAQRAGEADPDQVPGPKHDLGIGDHAARQAYRACATKIRIAHQHLIRAASLAGATRIPGPPPWQHQHRPDLGDMLTVLEAMRMLVDIVETYGGRDSSSALTRARRETFGAWQALNAWDSRGRRGPARPQQVVVDKKNNCKTCGIRPRSKGEGGRCAVCARYRRRKGHERPASADPFHQAMEAKARRVARGEGHGDESLSGARGA